jgi:hypothetical protein
MMSVSTLARAERRLLRPAEPGTFTGEELDCLPEPARRHLTQTIALGTPLATSARLRMRGQIRIGRWLPFRARQVLDPHHGFVWAARTAGVITGSDRYVDGAGGMDWKLAGFDGLTIPSAGRVGWFFGTDRWPASEFFRYQITDLHLVGAADR